MTTRLRDSVALLALVPFAALFGCDASAFGTFDLSTCPGESTLRRDGGAAGRDGGLVTDCGADLFSDIANCGSCGTVCQRTAHATATACRGGLCVITSCQGGFGDCDNVYSNGCEVNLFVSINECGNCGAACVLTPGALTLTCAAPMGCAIANCQPGRGDCDLLYSNGCEVDLGTDPAHCGACANACPTPPRMTTTCAAGACSYQCKGEDWDVDGMLGNGCEIASRPLGNHEPNSAAMADLNVTSCDRGTFTNQIIGHILADRRDHPDLSLLSNGTVSNWWSIAPLAEKGCNSNLDIQLLTSGGNELDPCFRVTFFTNQNSYSIAGSGNGSVTLGDQPNAYTGQSPILVKVEKRTDLKDCNAPTNEDVFFIINYHL